MMRAAIDVVCVFRIHLARLRAERGPFLLAAFVYPGVMYMFASAIGTDGGRAADGAAPIRCLAGSIVFSLSLTGVSWLGYLLLENRFMGRLKLFATLPLAPWSYVIGVVLFALVQAAAGTITLCAIAHALGVRTSMTPASAGLLATTVLITVLCVCGIAVIIAAWARSFSEGSVLTDGLGAGLVFLAPVYCTPSALPRAVEMLSRALPTTYAARGVQAALTGAVRPGGDLAVLVVMAAVTLSIAFRAMRWPQA
jgi:ABC-type multidrug transport system permease subunit